MATTTASLTLTSTDLFDDSLSISNTSTCYKAGTTIGLDQTTGKGLQIERKMGEFIYQIYQKMKQSL